MYDKLAQNIKLVVADVDGTLLNSLHQLTAPTREVLLSLQHSGVHFSLATGKILPSVIEIIEQLGLTQPIILSNGALVQWPNGDVLFESPIPQHCIPELISTANEYGVDFALYRPDRIFVMKNTYNTMLVVDFGDPIPQEANVVEIADQSFEKFLILERKDLTKLERIENLLNAKLGKDIKAIRSVPGMLEVFNVETSKSISVQKLAAFIGLKLDQVMVIGDSYNDLDMFHIAGIAVAMGNAPQVVQEKAHITIRSNDEDGIARFLKEIFPSL